MKQIYYAFDLQGNAICHGTSSELSAQLGVSPKRIHDASCSRAKVSGSYYFSKESKFRPATKIRAPKDYNGGSTSRKREKSTPGFFNVDERYNWLVGMN